MFKNPVKIADSSPFQVALHILVCPALLVGAWMMWDDESTKFSSMARMFAFLGVVFFPYTLLLERRYHTCGSLFVSDGKVVVTPWKENLASVRIPINRLEFPNVKIETDDEGRLVLLTALNGTVIRKYEQIATELFRPLVNTVRCNMLRLVHIPVLEDEMAHSSHRLVKVSNVGVVLHLIACPLALLMAGVMWDDPSIKFRVMARLFAAIGAGFLPYMLGRSYLYYRFGALAVHGDRLVVSPLGEKPASLRLPVRELDSEAIRLTSDESGLLSLVLGPGSVITLQARTGDRDHELSELNARLRTYLNRPGRIS